MHNTTNSQYDDELLRPFKLGLVLVCPAKNQIQINEVTKKVQPKAMAVLAYLANHKDRVISSEELIEALWAGRIVTQSSVQKSINTIRKLLADHLPDQIVIENYSKKGYQLVLNPEFRQSTEMLIKADATPSLLKSYKVIATIVIFMIFSTFIGYLYTTDLSHFPERQHKTLFTKNQAMDAPVLNASFVLPHPINEDLLYSRNEILNKRESLQVLMIKGSQSLEEWRLASTKGVWVQSAWSENGRHLVAIEQQESNLQPLRSFYGQVPLLYTIHIFTLNLTTRTLEEKQLLSQWHGRINSVTWSNNESFEFVATQGENTTFQRFKYSPNVQTLELVEPTPTTQLATYSVAHGNLVALSSQRKNGSEIHFIDKRQQVKSSWAIDFKVSELSWIPDGSGVLISAAGLPKLTLLYLNGEQVNIPVDVSNIEQSLKARFSSDGQKIYYANNQSKGELILERIKDRTDETQAKVVTGELGILSQNGLGIIYVKRGSSGIQIRKIDRVQKNKHFQQTTRRNTGTSGQHWWCRSFFRR
ncbi:winged helix-turn-helix domain-containing protein [Paraglaciecola sp.]|uniref:winged helix-turn-helix domain-containing protein n=1 Tax=Paraglaciecola sp. TaxID=1920173 RepID=UPI003EF39C61